MMKPETIMQKARQMSKDDQVRLATQLLLSLRNDLDTVGTHYTEAKYAANGALGEHCQAIAKHR